ncbi:uncharacterized protein DEA37_0005828 [Paragonimus westermani]|uniref:Uncharacterized protein n=1 Tax=Paragonimus westermani TaxID=34504 RepID=A0A5J4NXI8_9TREM|nr:uncharacterized protein DEA37_0005828 [Paragonimus westermani]
MVRISTHPLRLLALKYGADYVFSEVSLVVMCVSFTHCACYGVFKSFLHHGS